MDSQLTKGVVIQMSVVDIKKPVTSHIKKQMQIKMIFICFTKIDEDKSWTNDHSCKSAEKQEFLFFFKFIYFFLSALGLHCCAQAFSSCGVQAAHCSGFPRCRAWAQENAVFDSCGAQA